LCEDLFTINIVKAISFFYFNVINEHLKIYVEKKLIKCIVLYKLMHTQKHLNPSIKNNEVKGNYEEFYFACNEGRKNI